MKKGGFATKEEAEYAAFHFERQRVNHEYVERAGMSAGDTLFRDYIWEWFENRTGIRGVTRLVYERVLELILPEIGDVMLRSVNSNYLSQMIAAIAKQRTSYGEKLYELLNMAIGDAF